MGLGAGEAGLQCAEVAVAIPLDHTLHYRVPEKWQQSIAVGKRLLVPLRSRSVTGYLVRYPVPEPQNSKVKDIISVIDEAPLFPPSMLPFFQWISSHYLAPLGEVIKAALPAGINIQSREVVHLTSRALSSLQKDSSLPRDLERLLKFVHSRGSVSLTALKKQFSDPSSKELLTQALRKSFLSSSIQVEKPRMKGKTETWVLYSGSGNEEEGASLRSSRQREILQFLRERKKVPLRELRSLTSDPRRTVNRFADLGLAELYQEEVARISYDDPLEPPAPAPTLTSEQQDAVGQMAAKIKTNRFSAFLLHGITASGKTEVYLHVIAEALKMNKQAIVLVPEISLTPQLLDRFRSRFGERIAVLHSGLSEGERYDQWQRILSGEASIAIGARSAIFAPFDCLGVIIVDEEHETSYKQEEQIRYHARDAALARGEQTESVVILGSATPSLETYWAASQKRINYCRLSSRIGPGVLPKVEIVDLRHERKGRGGVVIFSELLRNALAETIQSGEQIILFLNRRGYSSFLLCRQCGFVVKCPQCDIALTYHRFTDNLHCHYCEKVHPFKKACPQCGHATVRTLGLGTERIEEEVKRLFPGVNLERMDRDTTRRKGSHRRILAAFQRGEAQILLGTQMVAKGLDFPGVTLVGVICADIGLHFPDFRSGERTFQLLTQVSGRAGRGKRPGRVIVQTYNPDHYSIQTARKHDFFAFYKQDIVFREELLYPPFSHLVQIQISGSSKKRSEEASAALHQHLIDHIKKGGLDGNSIEILGPTPSPYQKLKGRYRYQSLIKCSASSSFISLLHHSIDKFHDRKIPGIKIDIDVDPVSML